MLIVSMFFFFQTGKRPKANIIFNTSLEPFLGSRSMQMPYRRLSRRGPPPLTTSKISLEVRVDKQEAIFENLDKPGETQVISECGGAAVS